MDVPVIVHDRRTSSKLHIQIRIEESDTIRLVEEKIWKSVKLSAGDLNILLCGKVLDKETLIKDLLLGPSTALIALAIETKQDGSLKNESVASNTPNIGSFYVYCKKCEDVERGKLRIYCASCSSSAVVVKQDPSGWDDVLRSNFIPIDCEDCVEDRYATFKFKCVKCSEICAPLSNVRGNWERSECCVCFDDKQLFVFDLGCNHATCKDCFSQYCLSALNDVKFRLQSPYGYTLTCPYLNCDNCLKDVHHLRVMGSEQYQRYQSLATEKLISMDEQGFFCPFPSCGMSFIWEDESDPFVSCPECSRRFCRRCKSIACECLNENETKRTIVATTKQCPRCHVNTERNGGCAHMQCTSCGFDWCFRCVKAWAESCQFDHWFD